MKRTPADKIYLQDFGERLKLARVNRRMSQQDLAFKAGVSLGSIARVEQGQQLPSIPIFVKIVEALKVDPKTILFDDDIDLTPDSVDFDLVV